jgi:cytochrome c oxidase subunit 2
LFGAIGGATAITILTLLGLLTAAIATGRATQRADRSNALAITVVGNQWWWSVEYAAPQPSDRVRLANELHLPRGRPAVISLASNDVIHSFWVPNLHGKVDLIPGRTNEIVLRGDQNGEFRGQCAEYCGVQHAHMALIVIVEDPADFEAWLTAQRRPAAEPTTDPARRGRQLVETTTCAMCHTVRGTTAGARTAPDLTHVGSRATIAAGLLPNTEAALDRWLRNPQDVKPGNKMPVVGLPDDDRAAVVAYLRTLR